MSAVTYLNLRATLDISPKNDMSDLMITARGLNISSLDS